MKKAFLIIAFITFSVSGSSSNSSLIEVMGKPDCQTYSFEAIFAELQAYGYMPIEEAEETMDYYEDLCEEAGGYDNILLPVFL
tara:strand:- start:26666 stop:26914 length:249 start_codon:yes stop_codon:yes gene_type:complete